MTKLSQITCSEPPRATLRTSAGMQVNNQHRHNKNSRCTLSSRALVIEANRVEADKHQKQDSVAFLTSSKTQNKQRDQQKQENTSPTSVLIKYFLSVSNLLLSI